MGRATTLDHQGPRSTAETIKESKPMDVIDGKKVSAEVAETLVVLLQHHPSTPTALPATMAAPSADDSVIIGRTFSRRKKQTNTQQI